jgi:hypothetical protein
MAAPPYFTTTRRPAKRWMYGRASLRTDTRNVSWLLIKESEDKVVGTTDD